MERASAGAIHRKNLASNPDVQSQLAASEINGRKTSHAMNSDDPNTSIEAAYRGVNRGLMARIHELENKIQFWRISFIGALAIIAVLVGMLCNR